MHSCMCIHVSMHPQKKYSFLFEMYILPLWQDLCPNLFIYWHLSHVRIWCFIYLLLLYYELIFKIKIFKDILILVQVYMGIAPWKSSYLFIHNKRRVAIITVIWGDWIIQKEVVNNDYFVGSSLLNIREIICPYKFTDVKLHSMKT